MSQDTDLAKEDVRDQKLTTEWEQRLKRIRDDVAALRRCKPILVGESSKLLNELEAATRECTVEISALLNERHNAVLAKIKAELALENARVNGFPLEERLRDPLFLEGYIDGREGRPIQSHAPRYTEGHQEGVIRQPTRI